jgi:hypothetical protein
VFDAIWLLCVICLVKLLRLSLTCSN